MTFYGDDFKYSWWSDRFLPVMTYCIVPLLAALVLVGFFVYKMVLALT